MFENWPNENALITDPMISYWIFALLILWPIYRISKRLGVPAWSVIPIFVPFIGFIITFGCFAHMKWNNFDTKLFKKKTDEEDE